MSWFLTTDGQSIGTSASACLPNEYSVLISVRIDWLALLAVQETLKSVLQDHSSKASILWCPAFFMVQLSHPYLTIRKTKSESESHSVMSYSLRPHGHTYNPWNSPGQNTGVGSLSLLWGIFLTKASNPGLLHCRQILYQLSHKESPRVLEWVAYPFSSGPSQPRNQPRISCIAGRFFTNWAMRKALRTFVGKVMHLKIMQKD